MAKLSKDELYPCLLDRLTNNSPLNDSETIKDRSLTVEQLKNYTKRDLEWLLNTNNLEYFVDLRRYPNVKSSVLNYGIPSVSGMQTMGIDNRGILSKQLKKAIENFEPRIAKLNVVISEFENQSSKHFNKLELSIEGDLWANPISQYMRISSNLDLITDKVTILD